MAACFCSNQAGAHLTPLIHLSCLHTVDLLETKPCSHTGPFHRAVWDPCSRVYVCPLVVTYGIAKIMKHWKMFCCYNISTVSFLKHTALTNKSSVPEDAQCLSDSRRLVLANLTTHLKGSSRSVMVLLVWSLNFVSSWGKNTKHNSDDHNIDKYLIFCIFELI